MRVLLGQLDSLQVKTACVREDAHGLELFCNRVPVDELRVRPSSATLERKPTRAQLPIDPDKPEELGNRVNDVGVIREHNGEYWFMLPNGRRSPAASNLAVTLT